MAALRATICLANSSDLEALREVDPLASTDERRKAQIGKWVEKGQVYVARHGEEVVGYGALHHSFFDRAFIAMLFVDANYRRQGIGTTIIQCLEDRAETAAVFTSTNQSNVTAQRLFTGLGYRRSGVVENLNPGDPEWLYVKTRSVTTRAPSP